MALSSRSITAARTATCRAQHRTLVAVHVFNDAHAVAHGAGMYVVLGAGLDTFALRNPFPALQVVEIDPPTTQDRKRERHAAAAGLAVPAVPALRRRGLRRVRAVCHARHDLRA